LHLIILLST
jgi:hypothetical protein